MSFFCIFFLSLLSVEIFLINFHFFPHSLHSSSSRSSLPALKNVIYVNKFRDVDEKKNPLSSFANLQMTRKFYPQTKKLGDEWKLFPLYLVEINFHFIESLHHHFCLWRLFLQLSSRAVYRFQVTRYRIEVIVTEISEDARYSPWWLFQS